jgi:hypothetical protein
MQFFRKKARFFLSVNRLHFVYLGTRLSTDFFYDAAAAAAATAAATARSHLQYARAFII